MPEEQTSREPEPLALPRQSVVPTGPLWVWLHIFQTLANQSPSAKSSLPTICSLYSLKANMVFTSLKG